MAANAAVKAALAANGDVTGEPLEVLANNAAKGRQGGEQLEDSSTLAQDSVTDTVKGSDQSVHISLRASESALEDFGGRGISVCKCSSDSSRSTEGKNEFRGDHLDVD